MYNGRSENLVVSFVLPSELPTRVAIFGLRSCGSVSFVAVRSPPCESTSDTHTRHLLLQFTGVAAKKQALIFVLANQKQRHAVLHSIAMRVKHHSFADFMALIGTPASSSGCRMPSTTRRARTRWT